ncbi:MAG: transcription termination/antitermination protein NusG [Prevotella sp.]|nr:transcription termination/antitermination protein NusG [Prevotella sp.]MCD8289756.1 transcription termination/antitermination protein NusG [Prevotella sp.]
MAEADKKWYVFRTVSGKEAKAKEYIETAMTHDKMLSSHVSELLLPMEKQTSLRNGKRVEKEKLRLPGYLFVLADMNGDVAHALRFTPNVLGVLGGMDNPTPVSSAEINRMVGAAEETFVRSEMDIPYLVGETVKVTDGPFTGFSGVVEEVSTEKRKLKVMVKIFGRKTPLELSYMQVEKEG